MKTKLTFFCILVAVLTSFSQDKSFDIENYKFPIYKWREFKFNFNNDYYDNYNRLRPSLNIGFLYESLKPKVVDSLNLSISSKSYNYSHNFEIDHNLLFNFYFDRKVYLKENKFFIDWSNKFEYYYSNFEWSYEKEYGGYELLNTTDHAIGITIGFGFGFGRLEKVSNFCQAQYILKKLKKENLLSRELEEADIFEFADLSTKLKNDWHFNSRHKTGSDIIELDSFLSKQGLITDQNSLESELLSKYWRFGNFQERKSGHELKFGFGPEYYTRLSKKEGDEDNAIDNSILGVLNVSFENYKQLDYNWEYNFRMGVGNTIYFVQVIDPNSIFYSEKEGSYFNSIGGIGCGYYPDLRSAIKLSVDYKGNQRPATNYRDSYWQNYLYMSLTGDYYVLPRFRISLGINLNYYWDNDSRDSIKNLRPYYSLGLHYSIF